MKQSGVEAIRIIKTTAKQMLASGVIVLEGMRKSCAEISPALLPFDWLGTKRKPGFPYAQSGELATDWSASRDGLFFASELGGEQRVCWRGTLPVELVGWSQVAPYRWGSITVDLSRSGWNAYARAVARLSHILLKKKWINKNQCTSLSEMCFGTDSFSECTS